MSSRCTIPGRSGGQTPASPARPGRGTGPAALRPGCPRRDPPPGAPRARPACRPRPRRRRRGPPRSGRRARPPPPSSRPRGARTVSVAPSRSSGAPRRHRRAVDQHPPVPRSARWPPPARRWPPWPPHDPPGRRPTAPGPPSRRVSAVASRASGLPRCSLRRPGSARRARPRSTAQAEPGHRPRRRATMTMITPTVTHASARLNVGQ